MCTSKIDYHRTTPSLLPIYPTLIKTYRTLIYNGDVDGCVPFNGNEVSSGLCKYSTLALHTINDEVLKVKIFS